MSPQSERRQHARIPVQWPTVFITPQFFGHGTVVDVSPLAWRIRGSMPVQSGTQLVIRVWPEQSSYLEIEVATVLWAKEKDFAFEIYQVRPEDEAAIIKLQEHTMGLSQSRLMSACSGQDEVRVLTGSSVFADLGRRNVGQPGDH
jgi:hypothetical protein